VGDALPYLKIIVENKVMFAIPPIHLFSPLFSFKNTKPCRKLTQMKKPPMN
jgi:hypothetical protein